MYIIENGMTVPEEYPSISHEKIVNRALQQKDHLSQMVAAVIVIT